MTHLLNTTGFTRRAQKLFAISLAALSMTTLVACQKYKDVRDPEMSELVLNGESVPEVNRISVPMPIPQVQAASTRAEASGLWRSNSKSFFGDRRAKNVGDLLTVKIEINDKAQLSNASERSRSSAQGVDKPSFLGYGSQIDSALPGVDAADLPTGDKIIGLDSTSSTKGAGTIKRGEAISLRIAATVIKVLENGYFVIAGRQEVKVNHELRELRIAGVVRSADISVDNTIGYDKIAEARIAYGGRGQLSAVQQPRYGHDFLEVILPY